jgi:hypothetical protein
VMLGDALRRLAADDSHHLENRLKRAVHRSAP